MRVQRNGSPIRRPNSANHTHLMKRTGHSPCASAFRNMLDNIHPRSEVEAMYTEQYGEVVDVIRDRYGIPACIKVVYQTQDGRWGYDYISPENVTSYEPYDEYVPNWVYDEYDERDWEYAEEDSETEECEQEELQHGD